MNPYLDRICGWFGAASCATGSGETYLAMALAVAGAGIVAAWSAGKIKTLMSDRH